MTAPNKKSSTTMDRTAGLADLRLSSDWPGDIENAKGELVATCYIGEGTGDKDADLAARIVTACNAFETMREALILAEKADRIHSKCQECEDGAQAPEACGDCFPSADDARIARRNVLKSLGVRMRDVDRARAIKAEPSICNCSQEDVHDYGPCGEDCRSLVISTLPVNDRHHSGGDNERLQNVITATIEDVELREELADIITLALTSAPEVLADPRGLDVLLDAIVCLFRDNARAALKGVTQPASDSYQADACEPASSEKFNVRSEWLPIETAPKDGSKFIGLCRGLVYSVRWELYYDKWPHQDGGPTYRGGWSAETWDQHMPCSPTHWMPLPSPPGAEVNFSNDAGSDAVSLKSNTSSHPATEAGKLSTDEVK